MNGKLDYINFYLTEEQRLELGLTWDKFYVYVYLNSQNNLIITRERIPLNYIFAKIKVKTYGKSARIRLNKKKFGLTETYQRYALRQISPKTYQVVQIHPRIFIKEQKNVRITPLPKGRRKQIEEIQRRRNLKSTKDWKNPNITNTNC